MITQISRGMRLLIFTILCTTPLLAWGQTSYIPLIGIPGVDPESGNTDFNEYINSVYALSISIAALLAVLKLVIAGVKWMTSDVVSTKEDAKKDIQGAILGLLIIIGAVIILTVINPNILNVDIDLRTFQTREMPDGPEERLLDEFEQTCADLTGTDDPTLCEMESCEFFRTDWLLTWIVNDPINRLQCSLFCSGTVIGRDVWEEGNCVRIKDETSNQERLQQAQTRAVRELLPATETMEENDTAQFCRHRSPVDCTRSVSEVCAPTQNGRLVTLTTDSLAIICSQSE